MHQNTERMMWYVCRILIYVIAFAQDREKSGKRKQKEREREKQKQNREKKAEKYCYLTFVMLAKYER